MKKEQLATFNDAVLAIVITLMVLEIKLPELDAGDLIVLTQHIGVYGLSFLVVAIVWWNLRIILIPLEDVDNKVIWPDLFLLFFISLIPLPTQALGEHFYQRESHIFYAIIMALVSIAYSLLHVQIVKKAEKLDKKCLSISLWKNWLATALYLSAIPLSFVSVYISGSIFILVPALYFLPSHVPENKP